MTQACQHFLRDSPIALASSNNESKQMLAQFENDFLFWTILSVVFILSSIYSYDVKANTQICLKNYMCLISEHFKVIFSNSVNKQGNNLY